MRRCEDCQIILDSSVKFCPKCGKQIVSDGAIDNIPAREVGALVASANLHRIRQEWDEAVNDATEALKIDPTNPDIPTILADIYEQRGMFEDALIWCQTALDVAPSSAAEKERLKRISHKSSARSKGKDQFPVFQRRVKIGALIMAGIFVLVVVLAIISSSKKGRSPDSNPALYGDSSQSESYPRVTPGAVTPASPRTSARPTPSYPNPAPLAGPQTPLGASNLRTSGEAKIKNDLQSAQTNGVRVDDIIADPRQGILTMTFSVPAVTATRQGVLSAASALSRGGFASNQEVKFVTARCLVSSGDISTTQIVFVGDIARAASDGLGANPTPEQISSAFTGQWWNPQIK